MQEAIDINVMLLGYLYSDLELSKSNLQIMDCNHLRGSQNSHSRQSAFH